MKLRKPDLSAKGLEGKAHSALLCDRVPTRGPLVTDPRYVSYWPNRAVGIKASSSESYRTPSYDEGVASEGGEPDTVIDLACLDDAFVVQWWSAFVEHRSFIGPYGIQYWPKGDHYDLWRTNCSTIVALAMKIGGADRFTRIQANTPSKVASYARDIAINAKIQDFVKGVKQKVFGG